MSLKNSFHLSTPLRRTSYGVGTVMHEILHKQAIGGGFTHNSPPDSRDMLAAITAVGAPYTVPYAQTPF